jgi:hypothetical protein
MQAADVSWPVDHQLFAWSSTAHGGGTMEVMPRSCAILAALALLMACDSPPSRTENQSEPKQATPVQAASVQARAPSAVESALPAVPTMPVTLPKPTVKLRRITAQKCGVEVRTRVANLDHEESSGSTETHTFTLHRYVANEPWGQLIIACVAFKPALQPDEMLVMLADRRQAAVGMEGAHLLGQREVNIGRYPAMELDTYADGLLARWHFFAAGSVLHSQIAVATDATKVGELLGEVRLKGAAARVKVRRRQSTHVPRYRPPSSPGGWPGSPAVPPVNNSGSVYVHPYTRKDGTRVRGHRRNRPSR